MAAPGVKREAVAHVVAMHGVSQRRACQVLTVDRSSVRYQRVRPDDAEARIAMKSVAAERRRFGYRRIHIMLRRQAIVMNLKKLRRLYREERLQVRRRGGHKRALGTRRPLLLPDAVNRRWSLDFVSDALTDGRRLRVLAIVDDFSRECLALVADTSLSGLRALIETVPYQIHTVLTDNGMQFCHWPRNRSGPTAQYSMHMFDRVCRKNNIEHRLTKPNHPWTNGQVERMNRTIKEATVKRYHYDTHDQLKSHLQLFVDAYNHARRLKTLRGLTPYEYVCSIWTAEPDRFRINPSHHIPGPNTWSARPLSASVCRSRRSGWRCWRGKRAGVCFRCCTCPPCSPSLYPC